MILNGLVIKVIGLIITKALFNQKAEFCLHDHLSRLDIGAHFFIPLRLCCHILY
jgi:hypothetical protein